MILAGEEFGDEHDRFDSAGHVTQDGGKQVDPVNYSRAEDPSRGGLVTYVSRLIKLRIHATCCREQGLETDNRRDAASFEIKFASNETSRLARTTLELRQCKQAMRAATMTITETSWDAVRIARDNGQVAIVHHGDMREIERSPARSATV
jgi:hypothetical protein